MSLLISLALFSQWVFYLLVILTQGSFTKLVRIAKPFLADLLTKFWAKRCVILWDLPCGTT